jgi:protein-S-isoprenylcysteine O-methyltransferase Ste14
MPAWADFLLRFTLFALSHSLLAANRPQEWLRGRLGRLFRCYRLVYNCIAVVTFLWVMAAWPASPILYRVPGSWGLLCAGGQFITLLLLARCAGQLGLGTFLGIDQLRGREQRPGLVQTGCYCRLRHPQYTLAILFFLLTPVMNARWLVLTLLSSVYFVYGALVEERRLLREFGLHYQEYRNRIPMFLPRRVHLQVPSDR